VLLIEYKKIAQILAWKRAEILYSIVEILKISSRSAVSGQRSAVSGQRSAVSGQVVK